MNFWLTDDTYVKKINGKPHLIRVRPPSKSASEDAAPSTNYTTSRSQSRSNSSAQRASVAKVEEVELIEKAKFTELKENFDKLAELLKASPRGTPQNQPSSFNINKETKNMAGDDKKEAAKGDASNKSTGTENVTSNVPPAGSMLPPGFQAAPGIYTVGGRTLALVPAPAKSNTGFVGPNGYAPPGLGQQYMYGGGRGPMMGGMMGGMMQQPQPQMGMGFGGFNSQYDRPQRVEVTQVNPATNPATNTITRHVCAGCGTLRSRKFQAENPLGPGEVPPISYCRKCQKEETSSESSDVKPQKSTVSVERRSTDRRQCVAVPMVDERRVDSVITARQKVRPPQPPIKVVEEYSSSYDSTDEMPPPPPPRPHHKHKEKASSSQKVTTRTPAPIAVGNYISNLIFGKKTYESVGEDLVVEHRRKAHREHSQDRGRGRARAEFPSQLQSHHHRHKRHSIYEKPSPLIQETFVTETVPATRHARSLDRGERPQSRARSESRPKQQPPENFHRYNGRGDYESYDDNEEIARQMYKAYLSDGAPMHEEARHYQHQDNVQHRVGPGISHSESLDSNRLSEASATRHRGRSASRPHHHHENVQHHTGPGMSHSESFDSNRFSEASANRRKERSASRPRGFTSPPIPQEPKLPDPVLQRPPDEVIVTTERYVFKKPELPHSIRAPSTHSDSTTRGDRGERSSDISSRRSQRYLTHDDKAAEEWANRYGHDQPRESVSRPVVVREEVRRKRRQDRDSDQQRDDSSSVDAVPGSFIDAESIRSQGSYYSDRAARPPRMLRHTESISTDRTSDYTTSSGSYSSIYTNTSQREREHASRRGDVTPRNYHRPQVPGEYISESEDTAVSVRRRRERDEMERNRGRDRRRSPSPMPRRRSLMPVRYQPPSVSDASEDDTDSDHATAGVGRSRSNSSDRGRRYGSGDGNDPSELTANDRIRSRDAGRRARRVSFSGQPDELHTYSQVSYGTGLGGGDGTTTDEVLHEIAKAREIEHRREDERREADRRREEEHKDDERRERRRRDRAGERPELKRRSDRERERQKDLDYRYAGGR